MFNLLTLSLEAVKRSRNQCCDRTTQTIVENV